MFIFKFIKTIYELFLVHFITKKYPWYKDYPYTMQIPMFNKIFS